MELKALGDDAVDSILVHLAEDVHDLLHFSRTCKRFSQAVKSSNSAWEHAFTAAFGSAASTASTDGNTWVQRYMARFRHEAHARRLELAARRLKASSTVQVLRQEVHRLKETLTAERNALEMSKRDLAALQKARLSQEAADAPHATYWLPMAVARAHAEVRTVLLPRNSEEREQELQQTVAVTALEVKKVKNMLEAKKQTLSAAEAKLLALQP